VCVLAYAADQVTKWIALEQLADGRVVPVVDGWFSLRLLFNPGAAFSLGEGTTWLFTGVAVVVVVVIVRTARRLGSTRWALALGFLLGGALGNLPDRLAREPGFARGHVIDFLAYADWFVGNVADIWIVGAAVAVAVLGLLGIGVDGTRERERRPAATTATEDAGRG
jgi:signal peptidase II